MTVMPRIVNCLLSSPLIVVRVLPQAEQSVRTGWLLSPPNGLMPDTVSSYESRGECIW